MGDVNKNLSHKIECPFFVKLRMSRISNFFSFIFKKFQKKQKHSGK
ncbi:hypothetical protein Cst_c20520 [Thermoclostridium stercorarium subsp. stercorarium DSM 8532]|uniref:Uncharacterized protein n=1 Tax=Thermoclostridium stercorarium (strain ATCC 35414 / DSM 8532 / NCIMB 11754) TaxID=1121335 RepID=L7VLG4_THES1|nr:hypothetical protein Cst_c20520 [Thermoclostridium stercorarium subsp. stercorarium DSM 8532]